MKRIIQNKRNIRRLGMCFYFLLGIEGSWKAKVTTFSLSQWLECWESGRGNREAGNTSVIHLHRADSCICLRLLDAVYWILFLAYDFLLLSSDSPFMTWRFHKFTANELLIFGGHIGDTGYWSEHHKKKGSAPHLKPWQIMGKRIS